MGKHKISITYQVTPVDNYKCGRCDKNIIETEGYIRIPLENKKRYREVRAIFKICTTCWKEITEEINQKMLTKEQDYGLKAKKKVIKKLK
jgi:DNA-directed RNA polymerase subunit RPC12/RpoP